MGLWQRLHSDEARRDREERKRNRHRQADPNLDPRTPQLPDLRKKRSRMGIFSRKKKTDQNAAMAPPGANPYAHASYGSKGSEKAYPPAQNTHVEPAPPQYSRHPAPGYGHPPQDNEFDYMNLDAPTAAPGQQAAPMQSSLYTAQDLEEQRVQQLVGELKAANEAAYSTMDRTSRKADDAVKIMQDATLKSFEQRKQMGRLQQGVNGIGAQIAHAEVHTKDFESVDRGFAFLIPGAGETSNRSKRKMDRADRDRDASNKRIDEDEMYYRDGLDGMDDGIESLMTEEEMERLAKDNVDSMTMDDPDAMDKELEGIRRLDNVATKAQQIRNLAKMIGHNSEETGRMAQEMNEQVGTGTRNVAALNRRLGGT